jgi:tetratricopeptide (TPR) repeat protein
MDTAISTSASIDASSLSVDERNYILLLKAAIAQESGRPELASAILSKILDEEDKITDQEVLYEALARKGFALATIRDFRSALEFLQRATTLDPVDEYRDNIDLYMAYCLQALGRLGSAKEKLEELLSREPPNLEADALYRLGAVYLQGGALGPAITAFNSALENLPGKSVTRVDIMNALAEADKKLTSGSIQ